MSKVKSGYVCQSCGYQSVRWIGKCPSCSQWNTLQEEEQLFSPEAEYLSWGEKPVSLSQIESGREERTSTGLQEFDRVLGGGAVEGSAVLIAGEPGIGKSTLLLQVANKASEKNKKVLYISGEESLAQIKVRANRLGLNSSSLVIFTEVSLRRIKESIKKVSPDWVIVDSIQTIHKEGISSSQGGVLQVKECAAELIYLAKKEGRLLFLIGHVTKEGVVAGPRILEHMVDTVLYFEGERKGSFRILRTFKNRFGSTQEIGVFEIKDKGIAEVHNPSQVFLSSSASSSAPGSVIFPSVEGMRPLLVELQALVTLSNSSSFPRRVITGVDYNRAILLLAVLEKKGKLPLYKYDVFINVVGGIKIEEPGVDLPLVLAVASSMKNKPLPSGLAAMGEVGLSGEVRGIGGIEKRIKEVQKLGFKRLILPLENVHTLTNRKQSHTAGSEGEIIWDGFHLQGIGNIAEIFNKIF